MSEEQDPPVGYASPPKHTQFKKGEPQTRRRRKTKPTFDVLALLNEPWKIGEGRGSKRIHPFELALQQIAKKAIGGDMRAADKFLAYCDEFGLVAPDTTEPEWHGSLHVPYDHDQDDWMEKFERLGPPPWNYEHDGISRLEELRNAHRG